MKRLGIALVFLLILQYTLSADPGSSLQHVIDKPDILSELRLNGGVSRVVKQKDDLTLIPAVGTIGEKIIHQLETLDNFVGVEMLFLFNPKNSSKGPADKEDVLLSIYNILHAVSTLKGIEYYSATRDKRTTLYKEAYRVKSGDDPSPLPDKTWRNIPRYDQSYLFLHETKLGKAVLNIDYLYEKDYIMLKISNFDLVYFFLLPLIEPGHQVNNIIFIPLENEILVYGFSYVCSNFFMGLIESNTASIYNRMEALYNWFIASYE